MRIRYIRNTLQLICNVPDEKRAVTSCRLQQSEIQQLGIKLQNQMRHDEQVINRSVLPSCMFLCIYCWLLVNDNFIKCILLP